MIIALNNKSNLDKKEFISYLSELNEIKTTHKLILCPTFLNIPRANVDNRIYFLGAQNVSSNLSGAFTGEISAEQLKAENVKYCIVGHSERRNYQKESLNDISSKIKNLQKQNITPILCVGETKEEKNQNKTLEVIKKEILSAKKILPQNKVLYGGSCNEGNIKELNKIKEIDGYLLGGISLKINKLQELLLNCN